MLLIWPLLVLIASTHAEGAKKHDHYQPGFRCHEFDGTPICEGASDYRQQRRGSEATPPHRPRDDREHFSPKYKCTNFDESRPCRSTRT
jgi:hypothetical protein